LHFPFVFLFSHSRPIPSGPPDTLWTKTFGGNGWDSGSSVQQTSDGGYIIIGYTESFGAGNGDAWLIKTDANGDTLWTKTFGGGSYDWGNSGQQTSDGGYIITGETHSFGAGNGDAWLIKTDANGDTLWTKTFGGVGTENGQSVRQTSDGGYIITGEIHPFGPGSIDIWLIKTDANGNALWTKTFGGSGADYGRTVQQTSDGGYIITGSTASFGAGDLDVWLIKTDANGDTLWTTTLGGNLHDTGNSAQQTSDGGYIITGSSGVFAALFKTDANGDSLWGKAFGPGGGDTGSSVQQTSDGGYIITGGTGAIPDLWLLKTNANGDLSWIKIIGGSDQDWGNSVQQTSDGGYIIAGQTGSFGAGPLNVWLIRVAPEVTAIEDKPQSFIEDFHLEQNYPNPFNPVTTIEFSLPTAAEVSLVIYNVTGQVVERLVDHQSMTPGSYSMEWAPHSLPSGVYFYRLIAGGPSAGSPQGQAGQGFTQSRKMILMK